MKVLVVGSGGREHTIVWKLRQSPKITEIFCAPGNGGISELATCVNIAATDIPNMVEFAVKEKIDLVVVAPDDPLVLGMVDALEEAGIRAFGPRKNAAIIEGSKAFSKELMKKYNIPTAKYEVFTDANEAKTYVADQQMPIVVKADGLALGKGVIIAQTVQEAQDAIEQIMEDQMFGTAGNKIVIEEFMVGPEVSILSFCDGKTIVPMVSVQDHKRVYDGDQGLNTGGMGTFTPSRHYTEELAKECMETLFKPTMEALNAEGRPFKGIIFFGLMLTNQGPKVLEYNARFGDPETQVVLPLLENDLLEVFEAVIDERLEELEITWKKQGAVCVIAASGGYPLDYQKGYPIYGIDEVKSQGYLVFHAGTKLEDGVFKTNGGRVLGVTALGENLDAAIEKAYEGIKQVTFEKMHYRKDIGRK